MEGQTIYERNRSVYNTRSVVKHVDAFVAMGLLRAERAILARLGERIANKAVLDIGVGAGRTVPHLHAVAGRYVAIDYAEAMVERSRARFPGVEIRCGDARDLSGFDGGMFDVAWFSYNGIDYVLPEDRERIIGEVHRVLKPRGAFVFSSHNLKARPWRPGLLPRFSRDRGLWRTVRQNAARLARHPVAVYHYLRNRRREIHGPGYAVRVDQAFEYRLLTYHTATRHQVERLAALGFEEIEAFNVAGQLCDPADDPDDAWIYYLARKRGTPPASGSATDLRAS